MSLFFAALLGAFFGRLLDPFGALVAIIGGWRMTRWWQILIVATVATLFAEIILFTIQKSRDLSIGSILIGIIAMSVWATASSLIGLRLSNRTSANPSRIPDPDSHHP